jgi:hypothetical protein
MFNLDGINLIIVKALEILIGTVWGGRSASSPNGHILTAMALLD